MIPVLEDIFKHLQDRHTDFEKTIAGLPQQALDWVPAPDMNSLCVLIVHTMGAERYWLGEIGAGIMTNRDRAAEFKAQGLDENALRELLSTTLEFSRAALEKLTLDDLSKERISPNHRGSTFRASWGIAHALEHTALHVGHAQITRQLWDQRKYD